MQGQWLGMGMATQCPAVSHCACGVAQGRGAAAPAALWTPLSPSSFCQFQRWLMQHEKEQMVAVKVKKSSSGAEISPAGDETIASSTMV